jgi:hypothetical protein
MIGSSSTGLALTAAFLERHRAGDLEGHFRGVHLVVGAVVQGGLDVDHRVAGDHAVGDLFLDALVDRRDVLARHHAADDRVDELVTACRPAAARA